MPQKSGAALVQIVPYSHIAWDTTPTGNAALILRENPSQRTIQKGKGESMEVYTPEKKRPAAVSETGKEIVEQKRSCPPVVETEGQQAETNAAVHEIPQIDVTTRSGTVQGFFESILPKGAENSITTAELLRLTGLSEPRTIRKLISDERAAGAVILSNSSGYFLPDDGEKGRQEAAAFIATVTAKGVNTILAVKSAQAFLNRLPGQIEIGGGAGAEEESRQ